MDARELAKLADHLLMALDFPDKNDTEMTERELDTVGLELLNIEGLEILEGVLAQIRDGCMMCNLNLGKGKIRLDRGGRGRPGGSQAASGRSPNKIALT